MRIRNGIFAVSAVGLFIGIVQGCATEVVVVDEEDGSVVTPTDASKPDSNTKPDTSPPVDAAKPDSAKPDTSVPPDAADAAVGPRPGELFDPLAPKEGAACPAGVGENEQIKRRCNKCGEQIAFCERVDGGLKVGVYAPCGADKVGAVCLPNERILAACGTCGQVVRNCDTSCTYIDGVCQNQVVGGCVANEVAYIEGRCGPATVPPSNVTDVQRQVCSAACVRGVAEPCAPRPVPEIVVSQTAAGVVSVESDVIPTKIARLVSGACPATLSSTLSTYQWVRVKNTGADSVNVTIENVTPTGAASKPDTVVTSYPGSVIPADRLQCTGSVTDTPESVTVNIPAGGAVMFHQSLFSGSATAAKLKVSATTNFIGPEPAPVVDHTVDVGAAGAVNQAISFVTTKTALKPADPVPDPQACPLTLTGTSTPYRYVRVQNNTGAARTVTLETTGGTDTMLAYYAGGIPADRLACTGSFSDELSNAILTGVVIPDGAAITVYVGKYLSGAASSNLRVTTTN